MRELSAVRNAAARNLKNNSQDAQHSAAFLRIDMFLVQPKVLNVKGMGNNQRINCWADARITLLGLCIIGNSGGPSYYCKKKKPAPQNNVGFQH